MKGKDISSNARRIITIDEHGNIVIPNGEIWMGEFEIADLFGVFGHTIHTLVKKIYRDGLLHPCTAERREHVIAMLNERHERFVMLLPARAGSPC